MEKIDIMLRTVGPTVDALQEKSGDEHVSGDDIVDQFALAIGAAVASACRDATPRDLRLVIDDSRKRIDFWARQLLTAQAGSGSDLFSAAMAAHRRGVPVTAATEEVKPSLDLEDLDRARGNSELVFKTVMHELSLLSPSEGEMAGALSLWPTIDRLMQAAATLAVQAGALETQDEETVFADRIREAMIAHVHDAKAPGAQT